MITLAGAGAIIKNSDGKVFLVKIKRRGMIRWELPTGIRKKGESLFLTLYCCIENESSFQLVARIGRSVCLGLNSSSQLQHQFFAMFYECKAETTSNIKLTPDTKVLLPKEARQEVITSAFVNWQQLSPSEIHPQHFEILRKWHENPDGPLFSVISDADNELAFYEDKESLQFIILDERGIHKKVIENKKIITSSTSFDNRAKTKLNKDKCMDPIVILSTIKSTLEIVEKFVDIVKKTRSNDNTIQKVKSRIDGEFLEILHDEKVVKKIHISNVVLSEWNNKRFLTLKSKIDNYWEMLNDIDEGISIAPIDEKARLKRNLVKIQKELCKDLQELVELHEKTLNVPLGDYYNLAKFCVE